MGRVHRSNESFEEPRTQWTPDSVTFPAGDLMGLMNKRIVIDAAMVRRGGGFTHLVNALPEILSNAPETRFLLLARGQTVTQALPEAPNLDLEVLPDAGPIQRLRFQVEQAGGLSRRFGADLYYSVAETAAWGLPCPLVVSFRNPNVFTSLDQGWGLYQSFRLPALRRAAIRTAHRAARVIFVSHASARWIGDSIGLDPSKRSVVHHGIDPRPWMPIDRDANRRSGILSVSTVYRYKNFVRLIEAWRSIAENRVKPPELTLIGDVVDRQHAQAMQIARKHCGALAESIHILGAVPYADIPSQYQRSAVFAFPSYLETFGHPLLEAMASDLPVVAAETEVFKEVAGNAAVYCDPFDIGSIASALAQTLDQSELRQRLTEAGRRRIAEFTWTHTAQKTLQIFSEILK